MTQPADDSMPQPTPDRDPAKVPGDDAAKTSSSDEKLKRLRARPPLSETRYEFDGEVGRGGMGAVLRVRDLDLGRNLAMKVILGRQDREGRDTPPVDPQLLQRFLDEAQITGQLDHPGVVPVHELGIDAAGRVYFTMRLVRGVTADEVFVAAREGRDGWTQTRALEVVLKVCDTMAFAHKKGVLHRDLKPSNVMVGKFGEVYVMDWGLAKVLGETERRDLRVRPSSTAISRVLTDRSKDEADVDSPLLTMDGAVVGTPCYMSPEQAEGRVELLDQRADVYAIGAMMYELLAGRQPYVSPGARVSPYAILAAVQAGPPTPIHHLDKTVPAELIAVCEKAMARDLAHRYPDVRTLADDVRAYLEKRVVRAYRTGPLAEMGMWVRRNRLLAAVAAAAVVILVGGVVSTSVFAVQAEERSTQVATLNAAQRTRLTEASWSAFNMADRWLAAGDATTTDAATRQRNAREALLLLVRAVTFDPANRVAWERLGWEASARRERWRPPVILTLPHDATLSRGVFCANETRLLATGVSAARLWDAASGRLLLSLDGVSHTVVGPDGTRMVAVDGYGTARMWDTATGKLLFSLQHATASRNDGSVRASFSRDGARLCTAGAGAAKVWDAIAGTLVASFGSPTGGAAMSPDGTRVATYMASGDVCVWDVATGASTATLEHRDRGEPRRYREPVVSFSADGSKILTEHGAKVRVWESTTGKLAFLLGADGAFFSPEGQRVVARAGRGWSCWDASTGKMKFTFQQEPGVRYIAFSPDGTRLATASRSGVAMVWDALTGTLARTLAHQGAITDLVFSADGTRLMSLTEEGEASVWDAGTGRLVFSFLREDGANSAAFSADGTRLLTVCSDKTVRVSEVGTGKLWSVFGDPRLVMHAAVGRSGTRLATASYGGVAEIWDAATGRRVSRLEHGDGVWHVAFTADGERLVTSSSDRTARVWKVDSGELLWSLDHPCSVRRATFDPDGTRVVTVSDDEVARVWDAGSGEPRLSLAHRGSVWCAVFRPDGRELATASEDKTAKVWDAATGSVRLTLVHEGGVKSVAFGQDGKRLVTASEDRTAKVWDASTGALLATLDHASAVRTAVLHPDGCRVVTTSDDKIALLWDASTSKVLHTLAHGGLVVSAAISPDGMRVVTASEDETVKLWDADTGKLLASLRHQGALRSASFSPDGRQVIATGREDFAKLWNLAPVLTLVPELAPTSPDQASAFAELLTSQSLSPVGELRPVTPEQELLLRGTLRQLLENGGPMSALARWLTCHGPGGLAGPGGSVSCAERADILIDRGGSGVHEALDLCPDHPLIHLALAPHEGPPSAGAQPIGDPQAAEDAARIRRAFLRDYDLARLPVDAPLCARAAVMLLEQGDKPRAVLAAKKALVIDPENATALRVQIEASR